MSYCGFTSEIYDISDPANTSPAGKIVNSLQLFKSTTTTRQVTDEFPYHDLWLF